MVFKEFYLQSKWFEESTPKNPEKATAVLKFTGVPVAEQTVTIRNEVYEFVESTSENNIAVILGSTLTADKAVEELANAINANSKIVDAVFDTTDDTCTISYKLTGPKGNYVDIDEDCTYANFKDGATKLKGGQYGTPSMMQDVFVYDDDSEYYYLCVKAGDKGSVKWVKFIPVVY